MKRVPRIRTVHMHRLGAGRGQPPTPMSWCGRSADSVYMTDVHRAENVAVLIKGHVCKACAAQVAKHTSKVA